MRWLVAWLLWFLLSVYFGCGLVVEKHCIYVPVKNGMMAPNADRDAAIAADVEAFRENLTNAIYLYEYYTLNDMTVPSVPLGETVCSRTVKYNQPNSSHMLVLLSL